ncbi:hypothetical protein ACWDRB_41110 [Nonomuraea sp. NPDC003707]
MALGHTSAFLDIHLKRDLAEGQADSPWVTKSIGSIGSDDRPRQWPFAPGRQPDEQPQQPRHDRLRHLDRQTPPRRRREIGTYPTKTNMGNKFNE